MSWRFHAVFGILASVAVAIAIAWGFMLVGSPGTRRLERFDAERLQDLQTIVREVHALTVNADKPPSLKAPLPKTLNEIAEKARSERIELNDPETGEPYSYLVKDESTFELCATFTMVRNSDNSVFLEPSCRQTLLYDQCTRPAATLLNASVRPSTNGSRRPGYPTAATERSRAFVFDFSRYNAAMGKKAKDELSRLFVDTNQLPVVERRPGWRGRTFDSPSMTFAHYEFDAGSSIHEHYHPQEEVWQVIEGELEITVSGATRRLGPGFVAIVPPNTPHSVMAISSGKAIIVDYPLRD